MGEENRLQKLIVRGGEDGVTPVVVEAADAY